MAESDSPRLALRRWSAGTDTPSRIEFDTGHGNLDTLTAIDKQGTFAARPAAGVRGTYYWDTTNLYTWRDDGAAWFTVGSRVLDSIVKNSAIGVVPMTVDTVAGQTADLLQLKRDGVLRLSVNEAGDLSVLRRTLGQSVAYTNTEVGQRVIDAIGANGQTADMLRLRNFAAAELFKVDATGVVTGPYLNAGAGISLLGASGYTPTANQTTFTTVTPALEVRSLVGGVGAYQDLIAVRHPQFDGTAVLRRLGIQFKMGAEIVGDAGKAGGMYVESSLASAATPKLVLFRGDAPVMEFPSAGGANVVGLFTASGAVESSVVSGGHSFGAGTGFRMGRQGTSSYVRNTNDMYFYVGGTHSDTPADPGGGTTVMTVDGSGFVTAVRVNLTSGNDASLAAASPAFMIGTASGLNTIMDSTGELMARNNGAISSLHLNADGGDVNVGSASADVHLKGDVIVDNNSLAFADDAAWGSGPTFTPSAGWTGSIIVSRKYQGVVYAYLSLQRTGGNISAGVAVNFCVFPAEVQQATFSQRFPASAGPILEPFLAQVVLAAGNATASVSSATLIATNHFVTVGPFALPSA